MDFPIHIDTISMGLFIVYFKSSQVKFSKAPVPQSLWPLHYWKNDNYS